MNIFCMSVISVQAWNVLLACAVMLVMLIYAGYAIDSYLSITCQFYISGREETTTNRGSPTR